MKEMCRTMRTRTSSRDPDRCLVQSEVHEDKETEEICFPFTEDNKDGNYLGSCYISCAIPISTYPHIT